MKTFAEYIIDVNPSNDLIGVDFYAYFMNYFWWMVQQNKSVDNKAENEIPVRELLNQLNIAISLFVFIKQPTLVDTNHIINTVTDDTPKVEIQDAAFSAPLKALHENIYHNLRTEMEHRDARAIQFILGGILAGGLIALFATKQISVYALAFPIFPGAILAGLVCVLSAVVCYHNQQTEGGLHYASKYGTNELQLELMGSMRDDLDHVLKKQALKKPAQEINKIISGQLVKNEHVNNAVGKITQSITKAMIVTSYEGYYTDQNGYEAKANDQLVKEDIAPEFKGTFKAKHFR